MKSFSKPLAAIVALLVFLSPFNALALSTFLPTQGGTGTSVVPSFGQILVGNGTGGYSATSTLATTTVIVQDKGGQVYNVKSYGAKGDGVTDDINAINAAIAASQSHNVGTTTPGIVFFPPGVYEISSPIIIKAKKAEDEGAPSLIGSGPGGGDEQDNYTLGSSATIIQPTNSFPAGEYHIAYMSYDDITYQIKGAEVGNFELYGKSPNGTLKAAGFATLDARQFYMHDIAISYTITPNPTLTNVDTNVAAFNIFQPHAPGGFNTAERITVSASGEDGFYLNSAESSFNNSRVISTGRFGFNVGNFDMTLMGDMVDTTGDAEIEVRGDSDAMFIGFNSFDGSTLNGPSIQITSDLGFGGTPQFIGSHFWGPSQSGLSDNKSAVVNILGNGNATFVGDVFTANANTKHFVSTQAGFTGTITFIGGSWERSLTDVPIKNAGPGLVVTENVTGYSTSTFIGSVGIGTSSPFAQLSVFAGGDYSAHAASTLFAIGSSTAGTATSTLFSISNTGSTTLFQLNSSLLKTNANGTIVAAAPGTDYLTGASISAAFPFTPQTLGNATGTLLLLNGGIIAQASSTIGNGLQQNGLTVNGGATTTLNAYFANKIGIGNQAPSATLDVVGNAKFTTGTDINYTSFYRWNADNNWRVGGVTGAAPFTVSSSITGQTTLYFVSGVGTDNGMAFGGVGANSTLELDDQTNKAYIRSGLEIGTTVAAPANGLIVQGSTGIGTSSPATTFVTQGPAQFVIASGVATSTCTTVIEGSQVYNLGNHHLWLCMGSEPWTLLK